MSIDWSKAPKDAQEYGVTNGYFYKKESGAWFYWRSELNKPWQECSMGQPLAEVRVQRPTKPQAPEWDGEGPTVGAECEYQPDPKFNEWCVGTFLAEINGEYFILIEASNQVDRMKAIPSRVRPTRAQAERAQAEKDRFELARDLLDDLSALDINLSGKTATALAISFMNRGWRKGDS